jgi:hypothetical protein
MVKNILTFLLFICFVGGVTSSWGQTTVKSVTQMDSQINSAGEEILPMLSQTGDSLFFARIFHEDNDGGLYSGSDIWMSTYDHSQKTWSAASNRLNGWNDKRNNFIVGTRSNEELLYLNHPKSPEKGIQFVKKVNGKWSDPQTLDIPGIPNTGYQGLHVSPDYEVILIAMRAENSLGEEDLFVVLKNSKGKWDKPINLGSTINTTASEISPFLSKDKKTLYFASKGLGGYGDMDIFMAERLYNSWTVWSKPKNLGDKINSEKFDGYYSQYGDSIAFFSSNRAGELADLYAVSLGKVEAPKARVMQVTDANTISQRNYLEQKAIKSLFGFNILPSIEIKANASIAENNVARELIYFLANKFQENPEVKLGIKVNVLQSMGTEKMVLEASEIASFIAAEMQKNGISASRIQYEGVTIASQDPSNEIAFQVRFSFFK